MDVMPGYKRTAVGVIPEDWDVVPFGEAFEFLPTATYSRAQLVQSGEAFYIHYGDIHTKWSHFVDFDKALLPEVSKEQSQRYQFVKDGDLIMADASEDYEGIGKCVEVKNTRGRKAISGLHTFLLRDKIGTFVNGYRGYIHSNILVKRQFDRLATGLKVYGVSRSNLKIVQIPLPPTKTEQCAITAALSDADALIESLEHLIAKKRHLKQGAMQELLTGRKRLPGFSGDWERPAFGEIFDYHSTATNSRSDLSDKGDTYYIHYGDIHTRFHSHLDFRSNQPPRIERRRCKNATLLKNGDWIMADASEDFDGIGKSIEILGLAEGVSAVSGLHTFLLREKKPTFAPGFKGHLGNLDSLHEQFLRVATGMKVFGVSKTALKDLTLPVPGQAEQTAIANMLSDMDAEIAALEAKLAKTRQIKQGMMHNLLTGRIRLV